MASKFLPMSQRSSQMALNVRAAEEVEMDDPSPVLNFEKKSIKIRQQNFPINVKLNNQ